VKEYVKFDPNIMRGLLYYTGTVFEAYDLSGSVRRAILGGGRYDNLLQDVGGDALPATGFAMGDVVIGIVLQEAGLVPEFMPSPAPVLVTVFDGSLTAKSYAVAGELRRAGINTMTFPEPAKLAKQFKFADKMKMKVAIVLGPEEAEKGQVVVKDLTNGTQQTVQRDAMVEVVRRVLGNA
jgi:histidyl-tRNA synthetase